MSSCLYKRKDGPRHCTAWLGTRTLRTALASKNQVGNVGKNKKGATAHVQRPGRTSLPLQEKRSTLRHSEEVGVVPPPRGRSGEPGRNGPEPVTLRCGSHALGERSAEDRRRVPSRPQNLKNTAGHFLLMSSAGNTRAGAVLPRTVRLKAVAMEDGRRCYISQREWFYYCLLFARC
jgi:hypothetical protein